MAEEIIIKKPYIEPAIIIDIDLETRAGSPLADPFLEPPLE
ncbi:MAG: hypothetical protein ABFD53_04450 [Anaerolineaceae bacterium]